MSTNTDQRAFPPFPKLPTEIRLQIWLFSLPTSARVFPRSARDLPPAAAINHESRSVYLSIYTKWYPTSPKALRPSRGSALYANLSQDILLINEAALRHARHSRPWLTPHAMQNIRHVLFNFGNVQSDRSSVGRLTPLEMRVANKNLQKQLVKFEKLETVTLILYWPQKYLKDGLESMKDLRERPMVKVQVRMESPEKYKPRVNGEDYRV